jgi:Secretion system C-terminal sorting domain/FG-GAP repeat
MNKPITLFLVFIICLSNSFAQQWVQMGNDIDGEVVDEASGESISMSSDGNTLAIGAPFNSDNGQWTGQVRVFTWDGSAWTQKGSDINGEATKDRFGGSVSMSSDGNTLAVGANQNDGTADKAGHVRVYSWSGSAWTQKGFDIDGEAEGDFSGKVSLSSDGKTLAIGASGNDGTGDRAGHVRLYSWSGSAWEQKGADIDGEAEGDESGRSVSMSSDGNTVAIGAPSNDKNGKYSGHVRVYSWSGTAWKQKGSDIDGKTASVASGMSVNISSDGNIVAIGAPYNNKNGDVIGLVRVFTWSDSTWKQKGLDLYGEAVEDIFGSSLSMSSDGNILSVGAPYDDGNGDRAGNVRAFIWSGSAWTQIGSDIDGEAEGDNFGRSTDMSSDGNTLAIGSTRNNEGATEAGHVRVFRYEKLSAITQNNVGSIKIYPNPSANKFTLNLGRIHQEIELKITDVLGQIVSTKMVESASEVDLEITGNSGIYLVKISTSDGPLTTVKVIKE